ncbi:MAG: flagellar hook-length control protein FliK [Desulfurivibrionaceae bacterium]
MIPILQAPKAVAAVQVQTATGKKIATNFSDYMAGKLSMESQGKGALFGMGQGTAAVVSGAGTEEPLAATNVAALLAQFVQDLKTAAEEKSLGAGAWAFPAPAPHLMQKLAKDAGMNESQLAGLFAKVKNQDGNLPLADLLASFSRHFQGLQSEAPITAPETDLPLVQLILERLGVPVAQVEKISQATVRGDNSFDLKKLAELVQGIAGERIADLSPLEAEQLQDLLAAAGVSAQLQRALLPERLPVIEGLVETGPPVTITLGRLKDLLGQAVQEVKGNQLQADPIAFLTDLREVLARSGFETAGPQLSSAVQGAVAAIFEKLMESVAPGEAQSARDYSAAAPVKEGNDQGYWRNSFVEDGERSMAAQESDRSLLRRMLERFGVPAFEAERISKAAAGTDNPFASREVSELLQGLTEGIIARLTTKAGEAGEAAEFAGNGMDLQKLTALMQSMEGKPSLESQGQGALFGLGQDTAVPAAGDAEPLAATNVAALLAQFVQDLKTAAEEKNPGAGEWAFPAPAPQLIEKMAKDAGMTESQLAGLFAKIKNQDGNLPLADLLASFSRHFQGLQSEASITAPETDLPLVQIILERLGVEVAQVEKISQATVRGDNSFDLKKLAELVQGIAGERIADLSPLEAEQLQNLLAAAGVSAQLQRALLPERLPVIEGLVESAPPVTITLGRLKDLLGRAVQEVEANQQQADPSAFLTDLHEVLAGSALETAVPQPSPAVQGAVAAIIEQLTESVVPGGGYSARDYSAAAPVIGGEDQGGWRNNFVESDRALLRRMLERFGVPVIEAERISEADAGADNPFASREVSELLQGLTTEEIIARLTTKAGEAGETTEFAGNAMDLQKLTSLIRRLTEEKNAGPAPELVEITEAPVRQVNPADLQKMASLLQSATEEKITDLFSEVSRISKGALRGDSIADLQKVADLLQSLTGITIADLDATEVEQGPVVEGFVESAPAVSHILDRLQKMLAQGVREVKANRLQADPLALLADLQEVLSRSGLETTDPRPSFAVQGELVAVLEKLSNIVELAKVEVNPGYAVAEPVLEKNDPGYWQENIAGKEKGAVVTATSASEPDLQHLQLLLERLGVPAAEVSRLTEAAIEGDNTFAPREMAGLVQRLTEERIVALTTEVSKLSEAVVRGDNTLDLQKVADLLLGLTGGKSKDLTAGDDGQLQNIPADSATPVASALDLLKNMLAQGVREVKANRLHADPLAFVAELQEELSRIGLETVSPRPSSAVEGNLVTVFEELMESVDLAKAKVNPGSAVVGAGMEKKDFGSAQESGAGTETAAVAAATPETGELHVEGRDALAAGSRKTGTSGELFAENNGLFQSATAASAKGEAVAAASSQAVRPFVHISNLSPGLQQQGFAQISQGVLQGLRNQEHHLVLTLYPKELGEVKVEMTVRDHQVAVSFVMENSRVKEVLESNLDQFRENMEKQGFALGDCMVSLNRDNNGNEAWQQFQAASQANSAGRRRTTLADLPEDIFYQRVQPGNGRANGVDLFA